MDKLQKKDYEGLKTDIKNSKELVKQNFLTMGMALSEIHNGKLYVGEYETFDSFLEGENLPRSSSYQLIQIIKMFGLKKSNALDKFKVLNNKDLSRATYCPFRCSFFLLIISIFVDDFYTALYFLLYLLTPA